MTNKNMMQEYLGEQYTNNHLRNFCLYWLKAADGSGDEWRKKNDMDCLYFNGDLRADTLMSAWTPVKWVANFLNKEHGITFYKQPECLKLLADDRDAYLPPKHKLVQLLDEFLELAEQRCNYILLPDRKMNTERYTMTLNGKHIKMYDEVPATLYYIFEKDALGRFFKDEDDVKSWVKREHLEMGFNYKYACQKNVRPLIKGLHPSEPKYLTEEKEIKEAFLYMIDFLRKRKEALEVPVCEGCKELEMQEFYEAGLAKFAKDSIFLQVTDMQKGYIHVLPDYEEQYKELFGEVKLRRYEDSFPVDKMAGDGCYANYVEYAYLALYDQYVFDDELLEDKKRNCKDCQRARVQGFRERAIYHAFKKLGLVKYNKTFLYLKSLE